MTIYMCIHSSRWNLPGEAAKEYFCYKNFYSIIRMGVVDAQCRFLWASCGSPGGAHDATVFKVSKLYKKLNNNDHFPELSTEINGMNGPQLFLAIVHSRIIHGYRNRIRTQSSLNLRVTLG